MDRDNLDRRLLFGVHAFLAPPLVLLLLVMVVDPLFHMAGCELPTGAYPPSSAVCHVGGFNMGPLLHWLAGISVWGWVIGAPSAAIAAAILIVWGAVKLLMLRDRIKSQ